jgi:tRNA pseudouridine55 synthase
LQTTPDQNPAAALCGLLPVNKPLGLVSKDVSRKLVRKFGKLHIGHVGTLDPAADGVLPVLLGKATRLQDHLLDLPKSYDLEITFGYETDTLDSEGEVVREASWEHVTEAALANVIPSFLGPIEQIPPLYSAVKLNGKPLYKYARTGKEDAVRPEDLKRRVTIHQLTLQEFNNKTAKLSVTCSKGTYVRTLVKDLATALGTCGTLTRLTRTVAAGVALPEAYDLERIIAGEDQDLAAYVIPLEKIKFGLPRWKTPDNRFESRLLNGLETVITPDMYVRGLHDETGTGMPGPLSSPVLLLNENDLVFGIGSVRTDAMNRITVNMKRGLK